MYVSSLLSSLAQQVEGAEGGPRRVSRPGPPILACMTLPQRKPLKLLLKSVEDPGVNLIWADSRDKETAVELGETSNKEDSQSRFARFAGDPCRTKCDGKDG